MLALAIPTMSGNHFQPAQRGYGVVYREGEVNHCPGCGNTHWIIGRVTAECAFCATAVPLPATLRETSARVWSRKG